MSEEQAFLAAILERPDDDDRKLIYADWLDEQGDPRAEYLRLMIKVRRERVIDPRERSRYAELTAELTALQRQQGQRSVLEIMAADNRQRNERIAYLERQLRQLVRRLKQPVPDRLQELAARCDEKWLAVVSDPLIELCGRNADVGWNLRFELVCDKSWSDLRPTEEENVRHCVRCNEYVHFCDNLADARTHAAQQHCIAVDLGVVRRENDLQPPVLTVGMPSPEYLRQTYEKDLDDVSKARLKARRKQARRTKALGQNQ
ncbi:MAG: TIGR02996 domain-containing protein [Gemmataceae bacterium]